MTAEPESDQPLVVTREVSVATLWLNRPARRNAIDLSMWRGVAELVTGLGADDGVRVLVVRGVGDHFCAGADISELEEHLGTEAYSTANREAEAALASFPKPTVAFIRGSCVGGGAEVAITCDVRIADTTARFGITPARLGIVYPDFALQRAVEVLGADVTRMLLLTGELVDAERALRIGLVHEVHEPDAAEARFDELVRVMADERSLLSQRAAKEMVASIVATGAIADDLAARWAAEMHASPDRTEGIAAFLERRPPCFTWPAPG